MPMSRKVFKLKLRSRRTISLGEELADKVTLLLDSLKSENGGLITNNPRVVYHYATLKELIKKVRKEHGELKNML